MFVALQGACMTSLRDWSSTNKAAPTASDATSHSPWRWIVDGGRPSKPDTRPAYGVVYCTGHQDGCVQLWDMYTHVPMLLGAVPSTAASKALGSRAAARPVSTLEFAWEQGLLISGHEGGEVGDKCVNCNCGFDHQKLSAVHSVLYFLRGHCSQSSDQ